MPSLQPDEVVKKVQAGESLERVTCAGSAPARRSRGEPAPERARRGELEGARLARAT